MTALSELNRYHLVMDTIDRRPQTGDKGIYLKQQPKDKLIEHKQCIDLWQELSVGALPAARLVSARAAYQSLKGCKRRVCAIN